MSERVHPSYLFFLMYMTQSGVIIFSLPRIIAETFGTNGWLAIPIISMVVIFLLVLFDFIYQWSNDQSIYTIIEKMLPISMYKILYILLSLFWTVFAFTIAKKYVFIVKSLYYPLTSIHWLMFIMVILIYFFVTSTIDSIFRITTFLFFLSSTWMILLIFLVIPELELIQFTTFIFQSQGDFLRGSIEIYSAFLGFEMIIFFLHHVQKSSKTMKYIYLGQLFSTFVYLIVTIFNYGFTSFEQLKYQSYPFIDFFRYIQLPFIERLDGLYFMFFLMKIIVTATVYLYVSIEILKRSFQLSRPFYIPILLCVIGFICIYPLNTKYDIDVLLSKMVYVQTVISIILPAILILYLSVKRRKTDV
ncbi:GerAB/ArcD/ProY family transporter [Alkalihalobacterium alkalinitrilicum]|uniref:GerAB/ArcD/ProY family transporter n=1 Tax=Alkalihalobacterium alkalinitrilicum TaxID=427920 RepID=UPI000994EE7F|nr:GerAB/ArcD/ProY family transporter [Alkalihalobacterium alkalinitrilicum]